MPVLLHERFNWTQLATAERLSLYNQWVSLLEKHGLPSALAHLERARAHDRDTQALELAWKRRDPRGFYTPRTKALDSQLDDILSGMYDMLTALIRALPAKHPTARAARRVLTAMFPLTLAAVVNASFVDEAAEVDRIIHELRGARAADVKKLHLDELVDHLEQVGREYRAAVDEYNTKVTYATVRTAQLRGLSYVAEIAVLMLARFHDSDNAEHVAAREEFFAVLDERDQRARDGRRKKRRARKPRGGEERQGGMGEKGSAPAPKSAGAPADFGGGGRKPGAQEPSATSAPALNRQTGTR